MAKQTWQNPKRDGRAADSIKNWIRNRTTLEFLGTWEQMNNDNFKVAEFDHFKMEAGLPRFTLSARQWMEKTNAIGIQVKSLTQHPQIKKLDSGASKKEKQ